MPIILLHRSKTKKYLEFILIGGVLLFSVLLVLRQANPARTLLRRDAGAFAYIGSLILRGDAPYQTAWDSKPPGTFLVNAAALWLGKGTRWGIWSLELLSLFSASSFAFLALRKQFGIAPALLASLAWLYGLNFILIGGNLTEEYSLFFSFLSLFLFSLSLNTKSSFWLDFGIGVCAGSSFLFRPNNIGTQISIALTILIFAVINKQYFAGLRRLATIGLSAPIPLVLLSLYLAYKGSLYAFWEAAVLYNFSYAGSHLFNPIGAFASGQEFIGFPAHIALVGVVAAAGNILLAIKHRNEISPFLLWTLLAFILEVILSGLSGRNYEHYFINWLPSIAFACAFFIVQVFPRLADWAQRHALTFTTIMAVFLGISFWDMPNTYWKSIQPILSGNPRTQYIDPISEYVNANTEPGQTVLVWGGQAGINFLSRRDAPTPYLFYPGYVPSRITNRMSEDFYNTLVTNPPTLIVDGSIYDKRTTIPLSTQDIIAWFKKNDVPMAPYLSEVFKFIHNNYLLVANIDGVSIYRLGQ